jgi:tRNA threonylcarbamoyladenosine modification (KEOPS) complex Cgi121 subunit
MRAFQIVDCSECGEEFNIAVTKNCPECNALYSKSLEDAVEESEKKKLSIFNSRTIQPELSLEDRLSRIQYLLERIEKSVTFFSWVLVLSIVSGFIWLISNS